MTTLRACLLEKKITKPWNDFHGIYADLSRYAYQGITSVEYGQIFHVMCIGKYYCMNMKYRINTYIRTDPITLPCSLACPGKYDITLDKKLASI